MSGTIPSTTACRHQLLLASTVGIVLLVGAARVVVSASGSGRRRRRRGDGLRRRFRRAVQEWLREEDDDEGGSQEEMERNVRGSGEEEDARQGHHSNPRRGRDDDDPDDDASGSEDHRSPEEDHPYIVRRVHDRLSFHEYDGDDDSNGHGRGDNDDDHDEPDWFDHSASAGRLVRRNQSTESSRKSERSNFRRQSPTRHRRDETARSFPLVDTHESNRGSDEPAGNETDYYPKNANWSHFDLTELLMQQQLLQQQQQPPQPQPDQQAQTLIANHPNNGDSHEPRLAPDDAAPSSLPSAPRRQVSLEGDYLHPTGRAGPRLESTEDASSSIEFVWTDAAAVAAAATKRQPRKGLSGHRLPTAPSHAKLPFQNGAATAAGAAAGPALASSIPEHRATRSGLAPSPASLRGTRNELNRAESLDDRTVWGSHNEGNQDDLDSADSPHRRGGAPPSSFLGRTTTARGASTQVATPAAPPAPAPLSRRSASVPDLTHLHRSSQHPPPSFGDGNSNAHGGDGGSSSPRHDASIRDYDRDLTASVRRQNVKARALYNACIMPHSVILIRHGQSMGNINEDLYSAIPDNAMPLTKLGWEQARAAGRHLRSMLSDRGQSPHFIVSPYTRTVETFHGLASAWCDPDEFRHVRDRDQRLAAWYTRLLEMGLTWHEDPRIREQDFGNYQNSSVIKQAKKDRHRFGAFYYRFPHGESASDVFDRISTFLDSLWRSFDVNQSRVYVIVTHGIAIRVLLARYFRYTISQFSMLANPRNCEMVVLRHDGRGRLQLHGRYELDLKQDDDDEVGRGETRVVGVKFHWRLRVLPPEYIRRVPIRVSYDDDPSATVDHVAQS